MGSEYGNSRPRWVRVSGAVLVLAFLLPIVARVPALLLALLVLAAMFGATLLPQRTDQSRPDAGHEDHDLARRWMDAQTALQQLDDEWLAFLTDPESLFLTRPLLLDRSDPVIGDYHRAWEAAKDAAVDPVAPTAVDLARLEKLVTAAWDAWLRADARARSIGLDNFRSGERVALRRARKMLALMDDPATTPAYRDELLTALRRALDQLETIRITARDLRRIPALMSLDLRELE